MIDGVKVINTGKKVLGFTELEEVKGGTFGDCTKEEYDNKIIKIQKDELESDRFKKINSFIKRYQDRENKELEEELFKIVGSYGLDDNLFGKDYEIKRLGKITRFTKLVKFLNSLTKEQIMSNIYLQAADTFIRTSVEDCLVIVQKLHNLIDNDLFQSFNKSKRFEVNIMIPQERLVLLPSYINEQVGIAYYKPQDYKVSYVNVLDSKNRNIYREYNSYVRKINQLATDIYQLQIWNLLSVYPEEINNYYFNILNNEFEHQFLSAYFVKKYRNVDGMVNISKEFTELEKERISQVLDLSFDEIITVIEDYKEGKFSCSLQDESAQKRSLRKNIKSKNG